jgi:hypothetical protein
MKIKYSNGKIQDVPGAFGSMFVTAGLATPYWEEAPARSLDSFKPAQVGTADWSYVKQDHGALLVAYCAACDHVLRSHKAFTFSHCGKNETCPPATLKKFTQFLEDVQSGKHDATSR